MSNQRVVMMGTGPFAAPTFVSLLESPHDVLALVTRPTPPTRGRKPVAANPMRQVAPAGLPVFEPPDINAEAARRELAKLKPDLFVVCDYGQILSRETLGLAPLGGINLHGSLLPKYRGAAPVNWALLHGDTETGISVIHMTPRLDAGPCLVQRRAAIDSREDAAQLEARLARLGVPAVHEAIEMLAAWDRHSELGLVQQASQATRAPRLNKRDGEVDWTRSAQQIRNQVRALKPWPGTYTYWRDGGDNRPLRLILDEVDVYTADQTDEAGGGLGLGLGDSEPGQLLRADHHQLLVAAGTGIVAITRIQPAGKRVMTVEDFLCGHHFPANARLGK